MKCDHCGKEITDGQYHYNPDKRDEGKKFCSLYCMHQYYGEPCEHCNKKVIQWFTSPDKNDGKKFCSDHCLQAYYRKQKDQKVEKNVSDFWGKYKGLIIGGVVVIVLLIMLGIIFGGNKKKRRRY